MKMTRSELKEAGFDDEQIETLMSAHGKSVEDVKLKAERVDVLESENADFKEQLATRTEQFDKLKELNPEALQVEVDRLKLVNEQADTEAEARVKQALAEKNKDFAVDLALRDQGLKHPELIKDRMDLSAVTYEDGKLIGFDDVLTVQKEKYADLFPSEEEPPAPSHIPGQPNKINSVQEVEAKELGKQKALERHKKEEE